MDRAHQDVAAGLAAAGSSPIPRMSALFRAQSSPSVCWSRRCICTALVTPDRQWRAGSMRTSNAEGRDSLSIAGPRKPMDSPAQAAGVSAMGRVSRTRRLRRTVRNCTRDEGGPFEAGSQVQVSSHRERSRPSSWWRFEAEAEAPWMRRAWVDRGSAIDGMADCASAGAPLSSPAPSAHRCAAVGLDRDTTVERWA